mgnify:CR=1 FL=1
MNAQWPGNIFQPSATKVRLMKSLKGSILSIWTKNSPNSKIMSKWILCPWFQNLQHFIMFPSNSNPIFILDSDGIFLFCACGPPHPHASLGEPTAPPDRPPGGTWGPINCYIVIKTAWEQNKATVTENKTKLKKTKIKQKELKENF